MKNVKGKIILVDDEAYEEEFLEIALRKNDWDIDIEYFSNVDEALEHLRMNADEVFLIVSDMQMPQKSGMDFKRIIDADEYLRQKSIPFIFVTHSISRETVIEAYNFHVQGFFQKPKTPGEQAILFEHIVQYWINSIHPDKSDLPENPNLNDNTLT